LWQIPGISDQRYLNESASYILEGNKFRHVREPGPPTTDDSSLGKEELDTTMPMSVVSEIRPMRSIIYSLQWFFELTNFLPRPPKTSTAAQRVKITRR
jgi:hypothetical protein